MNALEFQSLLAQLCAERSLSATMHDLAQKTGISERTLWRYYQNGVPATNKLALKTLRALESPNADI